MYDLAGCNPAFIAAFASILFDLTGCLQSDPPLCMSSACALSARAVSSNACFTQGPANRIT